MYAAVAAGLGVVFLLLVLVYRWKKTSSFKSEAECPPCSPAGTQLVHRLCPHHNVVQCFEVEQKDSLDDHLDVLTRKLAEKEGRLRLSKSKIRETQHEIDNLHAIDQNVRFKYREIMDSLKSDLLSNEKECKRLQEQIEWVSRRRAELKDEVRRGQRLYGEAAAELATNLAELQRGRVIDKPHQHSMTSLRHRKLPYPKERHGEYTELSHMECLILQNMDMYQMYLDEPQLPRSTMGSSFKSQPSSPPPTSRYVINDSI